MASCSSRSGRDRDDQSGAGTADGDTYQALTVCIRAWNLCKSPFQIMGGQNRTPATIPRRECRNSSASNQQQRQHKARCIFLRDTLRNPWVGKAAKVAAYFSDGPGPKSGGKMSSSAVETLITNAIHTAFIKYPEGTAGRT